MDREPFRHDIGDVHARVKASRRILKDHLHAIAQGFIALNE